MRCRGSVGPGLPALHGSAIHPCRCCWSPALTICRRMPGTLATGSGSQSRSGGGSFASRSVGLWPRAGRRQNRSPDPRRNPHMMTLLPLHRPTEPAGHAPGAPGISPTWTSSAKDIVGCALGQARLWFTIGFGIVNEVYYPRVDLPQIRDLGFIVAGSDGFWSEVKPSANYRRGPVAPGVAAAEIRDERPRYVLQLRGRPDPQADVLLMECALDGDAD